MKSRSKSVWMGFLIIALGVIYVFYRYYEASEIGGIRIASAEKLERLTAGISYAEKVINAGELIRLQGQNVAFDKDRQTYYVSMKACSRDFEAVFQTNKDCMYYFEDNGRKNMEEVVRSGEALRLWIIDSDVYTICRVIFTGAPTMALYTDGLMSREYGRGEAALFDPDDEEVSGISVRSSKALIKHNQKSETYSVKLTKKSYAEEKKLSFLGIGENNNWKLYKVSENDGSLMRALLASYVWNVINKDTELVRIYSWVELIVNNEYKGLYLLAPKWTAPYLGLDSGWSMAKPEDMAALQINELRNGVNPIQMGKYALFLQAVYAYANAADDYIIAYSGDENSRADWLIMPDKIEYAFGGFSNKLNYLMLGDTSNISCLLLEPEDMLLEAEYYDDKIMPICGELWAGLRTDGLSDEDMLFVMNEYKAYIVDSGLEKRCVKTDAFGYYYDKLEEYILQRMAFLDEYYGFKVKADNG